MVENRSIVATLMFASIVTSCGGGSGAEQSLAAESPIPSPSPSPSPSPAPAPAPAPAPGGLDFRSRCAQPGVVRCVGFDSMGTYGNAELVRMDVDSQRGNIRPRSDGQYRASVDTAIKQSGAGSLHFQLDAGYASANVAGVYIPNTNDGLGNGFGENSDMYIQYAIRFSPEMISNLQYWDSSWKTSIFHMNQKSCGSKEIATQMYYNSGRLITYKDCGAEAMFTKLDGETWTDGTPLLIQQGDYACSAESSNCWRPPVDKWITLYYKMHFGNWERPNSTIEAWYSIDGQPYKKWINVTKSFTIYCNETAPCPNEVFNNLTLTPFMTGLSKSAPATAHVWYDDLIVSTQPIARP